MGNTTRKLDEFSRIRETRSRIEPKYDIQLHWGERPITSRKQAKKLLEGVGLSPEKIKQHRIIKAFDKGKLPRLK